jgi:hypothetical protein
MMAWQQVVTVGVFVQSMMLINAAGSGSLARYFCLIFVCYAVVPIVTDLIDPNTVVFAAACREQFDLRC